MFVAERGVNTQFDCANVCMIDMKTFFFRQEDMKTCFLDKKTFIRNKKNGRVSLAENRP